ncbi:O-antigen ligase family protein [Candidatus Sumerlaeota bacterium]|nr:O-antigen ligase family protein [Candidatus Sumerlaeota bacterium]
MMCADETSSPDSPAPERSLSQAERDWREKQQWWLRLSRRGLFLGLAGLILLVPWEMWSSGWAWHLCLALTAVSMLAIPWFGGALNWRALARPWCWGLAVFLVAVIIACITSRFPSESWRFFRKELFVYLIVFLGIVLGTTSRAELRRLAMVLTISGLLVCAMAVATYQFYLHGADEVTREAWQRDEVIDHDIPSDPQTLRAQFPLEHHNKLGFFSALVAVLVIYAGSTARRARWLWWLLAAVPLWALMLSLNRGGLVGLVISVLFMTAVANWRLLLGLLVVGTLCTWLLMPTHVRNHYLTIFSPSTYQDNWSSMMYRFRGWHGAWAMIRENPLTGVGYSWRIFEEIYDEYAVPEETQHKPHAHNIWLEMTSEVGVIGGLGFLIFHFGLFVATARTWWRLRGRVSGLSILVTLQLLIIVVGLISFYLREQLGVIIWAIFGVSLASITLAEDEAHGAEEVEA